MPLSVGCPRCAAPVSETPAGWVCVEHAEIEPLWRPDEASYDAFADHLRRSASVPTYLPWPLSPGWTVSDFAAVGSDPARARATMTCTSGSSVLDGPVDVIVVAEEAGTGLGARIAGTPHDDPGADIGDGPPSVKVRIGRHVVPLWPISTSAASSEWDRSVVAGEAHGRWLWIVMRPASAMLLLRDDWILRDTSQSGPHLVELPFGGPAPSW
ncbi:DUF6758 family protein [Nocardioides sp.]|uniref:DUF6758 family protein n=1 Tax=Nocardioides sp. TaxID=35761 RepID=UPI002718A6FF|nr:DUF6758 family protein [Nocardioides sp.]MDO9458302.1 hypothetical protein [Nocardioides sp.]